jgi:GTP-binding protein HflX
LSDTVGFIRDLPHSLIASFKATLEEARQADLLIHVADGSNAAALDQIAAVYEVLHELDIEEKDILLVINKVDGIADPVQLEVLRNRYPNGVEISAKTGAGLSRLAERISSALSRDFLDLEIDMEVSNGRLLAYLAKYGEVLSKTYVENRVVVHCRISQQHRGQLRETADVHIRPYESADGVHVGGHAQVERNPADDKKEGSEADANRDDSRDANGKIEEVA